ncbi:helix-turn-helix domain-containing protein [Streptomyces sp. AS58]|uniref:helix-turn-helix domain-containing protein n=1 Tax=Streptomyces sp. AS58 TaxID=1519489 RepID=UPI0007C76899|nr:helix-turn-helix domain-containing protein [Streptomyces sp. AS58]
MTIEFHTEALPLAERAEYWTDAVHQAFARFEIQPHEDDAVHGALWLASVGNIHVGHVEASPQRMARTRGIIANDSSGALLVSLQAVGSSVVAQDGREAFLPAGNLVVVDTRRPFLRDFPGSFHQNVVAVPIDLLDVPDAYLARVVAQVYQPTHYIGGILASFVGGLAKAAESGACWAGANQHLERGMIDVLTALIAHEGRLDGDVTPTAEETLRLLIRDYIRAHLDRPELSPSMIAAAHHISVRYLHKLFQGEEMTVSRWIHRQRLQACREDLARSDLAGLTVETIAQRWGFASLAHFSRTFRAAYGISPVAWRRVAAA